MDHEEIARRRGIPKIFGNEVSDIQYERKFIQGNLRLFMIPDHERVSVRHVENTGVNYCLDQSIKKSAIIVSQESHSSSSRLQVAIRESFWTPSSIWVSLNYYFQPHRRIHRSLTTDSRMDARLWRSCSRSSSSEFVVLEGVKLLSPSSAVGCDRTSTKLIFRRLHKLFPT